MKKIWFLLLGGLALSALAGSPLHAAGDAPESSLAYRKATLEALVAESRKERKFARRGTGQYSRDRSAYFRVGKDSLLALEPVNVSVGDVVGA